MTEDMTYYSEKPVTLTNIEHIAIDQGYGTSRFESLKTEYLNLHFGEDKYEWWQWFEMEFEDLWFDTEEEREKSKLLDFDTVFVFHYYASSLPDISRFMGIVMAQYGGWLDCKGDATNLITRDRLSELLKDCP